MRIDTKELNELLNKINSICGLLQKKSAGYYIDYAFCGVRLVKMSPNPASGAIDIFRCGHIKKADLYNRMKAFVDGMEAIKGQ